MPQKAKYMRRGHIIIDLDTGRDKQHKSINAAKRESRKLQPRLGDGTVVVDKKYRPKTKRRVVLGRVVIDEVITP